MLEAGRTTEYLHSKCSVSAATAALHLPTALSVHVNVMRSLHLIIAAASCVLAKPLEFDDLKPEKESLPYDVLTRDLLLNHKPFLEVDNSCDPAVAVSGNGETK